MRCRIRGPSRRRSSSSCRRAARRRVGRSPRGRGRRAARRRGSSTRARRLVTVSATVRRSEAVPRSRSRAAMRIARRAGSIERFCRSGCRRLIPSDVEYPGERRTRKLFVMSREPYADTLTLPPVGRSWPTEAVPETLSTEGAISPYGAPERSEFAGSVWLRYPPSRCSAGSYEPAAFRTDASVMWNDSRSSAMSLFRASARAVASASVSRTAGTSAGAGAVWAARVAVPRSRAARTGRITRVSFRRRAEREREVPRAGWPSGAGGRSPRRGA